VIDVLIVVAAIELLGLGEQGAGSLNAAWGIGGVVAGAAALALLGRGRVAPALPVGLTLAGLAFVAAGVLASAEATFPLLAAMGAGFGLVESALLTLTQRLAPDDVLGRVFGVEETIEVLALGFGAILAPVLVGALGIQGAMIAAGEAIVRQGEVGDAFYVIADGEVDVGVDGVFRRRQGPGEFFGEIALLRDVPRTATITAAAPVTALSIGRETFLGAIGAHARSTRAAESAARERMEADARVAVPTD